MTLFSRDSNTAEQGINMPLDNPPISRQPSAAQSPGGSPDSEPTTAEGTGGNLSGAGTGSDSILSAADIIYRDDLTIHPPGWPRVAAIHNSRANAGFYRRFGHLGARCQIYDEGRLFCIQEQLRECENDPTTDLRGLTAGQTRKVGEPYTPDRLDEIIAEAKRELKEYRTSLLLDRDTQALIPAYAAEVKLHYEGIKIDDLLDNRSFRLGREQADSVYTKPRVDHHTVGGLIYNRFGQWLLGYILAGREISSAAFLRVLQAVMVCFGASLLLAPTGLMYLMELSKAASFGLVVGFVVLCFLTFVVSGAAFEHVLVGSCAYTAVLMSMLFQNQAGSGCSSP